MYTQVGLCLCLHMNQVLGMSDLFFAKDKGADQTARMRSLISVFAIRPLGRIMIIYSTHTILGV